MEYNLLVPEGAEAGQKLPLVLFMADASTAGKEVSESGKGMEHMASFDYGYKIAAVRDWLFMQSK